MSGKSWRTREELLNETLQLDKQGLSRRAIARSLRVSRNTVKKLLEEHATARQQPHTALPVPPARAPRPKKIDKYQGKVADLLEQYDDITAQRVFEELRGAGFDGGYTAVKDYVRQVRPQPKPKPSLATPVYEPGEMSESDWSPYTIDFTAAPREKVQAFSYVLVHSKRKSFGFYERNDLHALMDGHVVAFERFDGCAHKCKYDSQKPVVLRWEAGQPIYNPRFLAFSTYYDFRPVACRRGHPNDKPRTERSFWELERSFFNGRSFRDMDDLRAQLRHWQDNIADPRPHKKTKRPPIEMFAEERDKLAGLPAYPYDTARVVYRVCSIDGFVSWDGNRYAVPYDHVTDILPVRITQHELYVYAADLKCVACYELAPRSAGVDMDPNGLHPLPSRPACDLDQLRETFERMGEAAADFFAGLLAASCRRLAGYQARQILQLRERYTSRDVNQALGHAYGYGAFEHQAVARILAMRAAPRRLEEYLAEDAARRLEQRLGSCQTEPRDLSVYDQLPGSEASETSEDSQWENAKNPSNQTPSSSDCDDT